MSFMLLGILNSQAAGGGAPAYDLLETTTLATTTSSVTFSSLGAYSDYEHLEMRILGRNAEAGSGHNRIDIKLNGDTGSNYASHNIKGNGSTVTSGAINSATSINPATNAFPSSLNTAGAFGAAIISILNFSGTTKNPTLRLFMGSGLSNGDVSLSSGLRTNTEAITSVAIAEGSGQGFVAGSRFSLYGIKGA